MNFEVEREYASTKADESGVMLALARKTLHRLLPPSSQSLPGPRRLALFIWTLVSLLSGAQADHDSLRQFPCGRVKRFLKNNTQNKMRVGAKGMTPSIYIFQRYVPGFAAWAWSNNPGPLIRGWTG